MKLPPGLMLMLRLDCVGISRPLKNPRWSPRLKLSMEKNVLVDSSFFIRSFRQGGDPFRVLQQANLGYEFYSCGLVMLEVCRGMRVRRLYEAARNHFAVMCWVPTTEKIWSDATHLARDLATRGVTMQLTDLVIAASALSVDAAVLTLDSDFLQVPDLRVIDKLEE